MSILAARELKKYYGKGESLTKALDGVSLDIEKGEFVAIIGASGSGKSTLLNMIGGLDISTSGKVMIGGKEMDQLSADELTVFRRRNIGFIFQNYNLIPVLNVMENITLPIELDGKKPDKKFIQQIIGLLGLTEKVQKMPSQLSGGQQQRVAIARAIVNEPAILLADEPTGNLDPTNSWEIMSLLKEANDRGTTVLVVTHNQEIVNEMNERVITMKQGVIVSDEQKGGYIDED